jgi:phosphoesterase RecJ-like protein
MFDTKSLNELRGDALAAKNMILRSNDRLALTIITKADIAAAGITENDITGAVDVARSAAGVLVGVSLKETNPGEYRISARSNCSFDVAAVCEKFGGGGHVRAAGGGITADTPEKALKTVGDAFAEALEKSAEERRRQREANA